ncbi:MAG TPA: hypothetical protein VI819_00120 [Patescibacteria group bacterium]|nr:hypothetical protein [Patescibacteria group bacterium]
MKIDRSEQNCNNCALAVPSWKSVDELKALGISPDGLNPLLKYKVFFRGCRQLINFTLSSVVKDENCTARPVQFVKYDAAREVILAAYDIGRINLKKNKKNTFFTE